MKSKRNSKISPYLEVFNVGAKLKEQKEYTISYILIKNINFNLVYEIL